MLITQNVQANRALSQHPRSLRELCIARQASGVLSFGGAFTAASAAYVPRRVSEPIPSGVRPPVLLQIGNDSYLSHSRELLLRRFGFDVTTLSSRQARSSPDAGRLDAVLICQTVTVADASYTAEVLQKASSAKIQTMRLTLTPAMELYPYEYILMAPVPAAVLERATTHLRSPIGMS